MRVLCVLVLVALFSYPALAADAPKVEAFGGFQYFRANTGLDVLGIDNFNLNGWNASLSGYFNRFIGVTADFSGAYGTPEVLGVPIHTKFHTFMFGPVIRLPNPTHITPFVHALGGGAHLSADAAGTNGSETDAAWAVGGGLDLDMGRLLSIRAAQVDYLQTRSGGTSQNNFRYSAGIVIKF
jgi:hypothetical protein